MNLKKQTNNTTFVNLRGTFIRFVLSDVILHLEVYFDNIALGLLSVDRPDLYFLKKTLWRLTSPSVTFGFSSQTRKKMYPNLLSESYERKNLTNQTFRHAYTLAILCCAYTTISPMSSYIFKIFLLAMFVAWVKPMIWNCNDNNK